MLIHHSLSAREHPSHHLLLPDWLLAATREPHRHGCSSSPSHEQTIIPRNLSPFLRLQHRSYCRRRRSRLTCSPHTCHLGLLLLALQGCLSSFFSLYILSLLFFLKGPRFESRKTALSLYHSPPLALFVSIFSLLSTDHYTHSPLLIPLRPVQLHQHLQTRDVYTHTRTHIHIETFEGLQFHLLSETLPVLLYFQ